MKIDKNNIIEKMINTQYSSNTIELSSEMEKDLCWRFCCSIFKIFNINLSEAPHQCLKRTSNISIPCIVLFNVCERWHSGVLWPDGLHFLHVIWEEPLQNEQSKKACYMIRKERLTRWPWSNLLEGFYINV